MCWPLNEYPSSPIWVIKVGTMSGKILLYVWFHADVSRLKMVVGQTNVRELRTLRSGRSCLFRDIRILVPLVASVPTTDAMPIDGGVCALNRILKSPLCETFYSSYRQQCLSHPEGLQAPWTTPYVVQMLQRDTHFGGQCLCTRYAKNIWLGNTNPRLEWLLFVWNVVQCIVSIFERFFECRSGNFCDWVLFPLRCPKKVGTVYSQPDIRTNVCFVILYILRLIQTRFQYKNVFGRSTKYPPLQWFDSSQEHPMRWVKCGALPAAKRDLFLNKQISNEIKIILYLRSSAPINFCSLYKGTGFSH